VTIKKIKNL